MAKFEPQAELPVSEQAQIRRDKLAALQAEGRDPFLQTKYRITGSQEANPMEFKLSDDSPFGRACVGKSAGDTFSVNAPAGSYTMKVVEVIRD